MDWQKRLTGKNEPEPSPQSESVPATTPPPTPTYDPLPDLPNYDPEPADGVHVGESPVPGITLKRILRGHTGQINRIAWSPNGHFLASPSHDNTIRIWDVARAKCIAVLEGHEAWITSVAWSPEAHMLASGASDQTIRIWDTAAWVTRTILDGHSQTVASVAWSPDGHRLASGSEDTTVRIWNTRTWRPLQVLEQHSSQVNSLVWSPDGQRIASASGWFSDEMDSREATQRIESPVLVHDASTGALLESFTASDWVYSVVWAPSKFLLAAGLDTNTIELWTKRTSRAAQTLEGHTDQVNCLSFSADGSLLASGSSDGSIRLWRTDTWETQAVLNETTITQRQKGTKAWLPGLAFHPHLPRLATLGKYSQVIRIWDIDTDALLGRASIGSVRYTTAKLVLVGDSGVGKTGLGWRLAHGEFKEHSSTHGQQFWVIPELGEKRADGTECDAVLWDLAGQHVYRPIHSIFLDNVDASLVLFDPTNRQDPLKGAGFWLEQLKGKGELPPTLLVGARADRGAPAVSQDYLAQFCQQYGISGGYLSTSAKTGEGIEELKECLKGQIRWDEMTTTVTTVTFKRVKDYVLALREKPDRKGVLVSPKELRAQLETAWHAADHPFELAEGEETQVDWQFTDAEMMTAVGHLETHGSITILTSSSGNQHILLAPDLLVDLASSIVLLADKHPRELGAVNETDLLQGRHSFPELKGLAEEEQQILLDAAVLRFLEHHVCFREIYGSDTLLIFPGLIKQRRPLQDDFASTDDVSYVVRGRVENLYAMLVVLLGYTPSFVRINQWQNQAQYEMDQGGICGFRTIEDREGEIELILYYEEGMSTAGKTQFQELFEQFLYQRDVEVRRFPPVICPEGHRLERTTVVSRIQSGRDFAFCAECGSRVELPDLDRPSIDLPPWLQREEAVARLRSTYEQHLARIKGYRRGWAAPRCYLSHIDEQKVFAGRLANDLQTAGVFVIPEVAQVGQDDYVLLLDTPAYQRVFHRPAPAMAADVDLVRARLGGDKRRLISVRLESKAGTIPTHDVRACQPGDFCDSGHYPVSLFNLMLNLYAIPLDHAGFAPLRASLHQQWEETLSRLPPAKEPETRPLQVFISYSHEDEGFKDALIKMLSGMQRRGVIDAWHDRRITPGDELYPAIQTAMNECNLALLLISSDFLNSRFISEEEVPRLLQRRQDEGMRVIPIIVRACPWTSEPVLKDILAMPRDGKPVIEFSIETGERDRVWTEIAQEIERQAKAVRTDR